MDENAISILCAVSGCYHRVVGDTRCRQHGGHPTYEFVTDIEGHTTYYIQEGLSHGTTTSR